MLLLSTNEGAQQLATLHVELVSVERPLWSGDAASVSARTTEGELTILPSHAPLLGQLVESGLVRVGRESADDLLIAVHGGFLSVTADGVSILAEMAEFADDIDVDRARAALDRARSLSDEPENPQRKAAEERAATRLRAAGQLV